MLPGGSVRDLPWVVMSHGAAFFDLDRTLLPGASGPWVAEALREVGLLQRAPSRLESAAFTFYNHLGETLPSMLATRQGVRLTRGWDRDQVAAAGELAALRLADLVQPWVPEVFAEHRAAGRAIVLASSSPYELCRPLALAIGCDDAIATRYGGGATFDGTLDGPFVWGRGKLDAVRTWSAAAEVEMADSHAYSDSVFDLPLLSAVGHPVAVNPDPRLRVVAAVRRWPVRWFDAPEGVPRLAGFELGDALRLARPELFPYARFDFDGLENIPATGPAIIAANHRSYFDPVVLALALARRGRVGRFMAKREVTDAPVVGPLVRALGTIRVDRGAGSQQPIEAAAAALRAGEIVVILPQGTIPRGPAFFDPELVGRPGIGELMARSDAPVIPVGLWGTEQVWPRNAKMPNVINVVRPPTVSARAGSPVELGRSARQGATKRTRAVTSVMTAISTQLPAEARQPMVPSAEAIARTYPSGKAPV